MDGAGFFLRHPRIGAGASLKLLSGYAFDYLLPIWPVKEKKYYV